jgi:hypothetical protein
MLEESLLLILKDVFQIIFASGAAILSLGHVKNLIIRKRASLLLRVTTL